MYQVHLFPAWSPARRLPALGQEKAPAKPPIIDSALVAFLTDVAAAAAMGALAVTYGKAKSRWATFFWSGTAVFGFKALIDGSRIREQ
jgi:hypothetical protein